MSKRRIMLFCRPGDYSGVTRYVEMLAKHFSAKNDVAVVTTSIDGAFGDLHKSHPDVQVFVCEGIENSYSLLNLWACIRMIRQHVKAFQPDVIQLNGSLFGLAGRLLPTPGRAKFFTYHGLPFGDGRSFAKNAFLLGVEIFAANWSRGHHIFISKRDMKTLQRFKIGKNRLHYVPNGISLPKSGARSDKTPERTNLVIVANNMPAKRLDRLIGAFALLGDSFTLTLVGDGTDGAEIRALSEERLTAGQRDRLRLMGRRADVSEFLRDADIFVLSSDYEGMPMSALEALSQGLFVVMPEVGGAEEICAEGAGLIYAPNTEAQLAASLCEAAKRIQGPDWSPELPRAHHERHFTRERLLRAMEALYYGAEETGEAV